MNRLNQHTQIVAEHFAQRFVNLRGHGLAPQPLTELRLDHMKGRFDVGPLVIVRQEFFAMQAVEMEHAIPQR